MVSKDLRMMLRLAFFVIFFVVVSVFVDLGIQLFLVLRAFDAEPWPDVAWVRFILNPFIVAPVFGVLGLWVGYKRTPNSQQVVYPVALVFMVSYMGVLVHFLKIRTTPEAAARAVLRSWGARGDGVTLSQPSIHDGYPSMRYEHGRLFDLKRGDVIVGSIRAAPFSGFLWQSGGGSIGEFTPDK